MALNYLETLPRKLPKGDKVIVHNRVHAQWEDQWPGDSGFRVWTELKRKLPKSAKPCDCGWSGLPHYRTDSKEGEPLHYGKPPSVKGKRMPDEMRVEEGWNHAMERAIKNRWKTMTFEGVKYRIKEDRPGTFHAEEMSCPTH
jgi:hypothetical protein